MDKLYNERTKELNDKKIMEALSSATKDYEDGSIIECHDILIDVINAITDFTNGN